VQVSAHQESRKAGGMVSKPLPLKKRHLRTAAKIPLGGWTEEGARKLAPWLRLKELRKKDWRDRTPSERGIRGRKKRDREDLL